MAAPRMGPCLAGTTLRYEARLRTNLPIHMSNSHGELFSRHGASWAVGFAPRDEGRGAPKGAPW